VAETSAVLEGANVSDATTGKTTEQLDGMIVLHLSGRLLRFFFLSSLSFILFLSSFYSSLR
jgi:hypothetical protein